jgi:hypothetical protein
VRTGQLRAERFGNDRRFLWAYLDEEGNFHLDGQDLGPDTEAVSSDGEYEWLQTIAAVDIPGVIELLGDPETAPTPIRPRSTTVTLETPKRGELQSFLQARAEVVRLSCDPKSTQDFRRLQNAQGRLAEWTTPDVVAAAS